MKIDLQKLTGQFGLVVHSATAKTNAVLSKVYVVNETHILRGRTVFEGIAEKFHEEQELLAAVRPLVAVRFPDLLRTNDGKLFVLGKEYVWTAYPLIEGEILCDWWEAERLSTAERRESMETLSKIHTATKGRLAGISRNAGLQFSEKITAQLADMDKVITDAESARALEALANVKAREAQLAEKDLSFVHGDFHSGNCVVENGKIAGLLDTDWSRKGYFLEDVAYGTINYLRNCSGSGKFFNFDEFDAALRWYGVLWTDVPILKEYLILYALYDLHGFTQEAWPLPNAQRLIRVQHALFSDFCVRF